MWTNPKLSKGRYCKYEAMWEENDECVKGQGAMERLVLSQFQQVYKSEGAINFNDREGVIQRKVSDKLNIELMCTISEEEVKGAVFSMGALIAPGLDGLNGLFLQKHWEDLNSDVFAVVSDFFNSGSLNEEFNESLVALVPKILQPECLQ
ncbi:hypothetical protein SESBI_42299 [Sesbania bispinosa]|nr:hypothetical protein SESBI_42299 [Sesbania bispinosa]